MTVKYTLCVNEGEEEKFISCPESKHTQVGIWIKSCLKSLFRRMEKKEGEKRERKECRFNEITFSPLDRDDDDDDGRLIILFGHVGRERSENESIYFLERKKEK